VTIAKCDTSIPICEKPRLYVNHNLDLTFSLISSKSRKESKYKGHKLQTRSE